MVDRHRRATRRLLRSPSGATSLIFLPGDPRLGSIFWRFGGIWLILITTACSTVLAQRTEPAPKELEGVGITEHLDATVPKDLSFVDSEGHEVSLGQFFDGRRPVVLTMNYSNCPMLCGLQLNGLFKGLGAMDWTFGQQFDMVTVSLDPLETPQRATQTKDKYLKAYGRPGAGAGWHWLVGREENIRKLADTVGFGYAYIPESKQYAHAAGLMICTPEGHVSRYLYGIDYDPQTLRLSLVEAADGRIGSSLDQVLLYCFHYDAQSGRYGPKAMVLMRIGAALTLFGLGTVLGFFWRRDARRNRVQPLETQA